MIPLASLGLKVLCSNSIEDEHLTLIVTDSKIDMDETCKFYLDYLLKSLETMMI